MEPASLVARLALTFLYVISAFAAVRLPGSRSDTLALIAVAAGFLFVLNEIEAI
jgi:hypothetical protein